MKAKVISEFIDKKTRKLHKVNEVIEVTKERFDEINRIVKRVQLIKEDTIEKKNEK